MKGDRVDVVIDTGGSVQTFSIEATKAGRRVEVTNARGGIVEVAEVTRSGKPVRTGRFMGSRLVALVEHPAADAEGDAAGRPRRRRAAPDSAQGRLL